MSNQVKEYWKEELAVWTRRFYEVGLSTGRDSGDVSLRDPDTGLVYINPRPNSKLKIPTWGVIKAEDMVVMDENGKYVEETDIQATVEAPMHLYLYRARPEIKAIVHSHAVWSTAFAAARKDIPMVVYEFNFAGGGVKCAKYAHAGTEELAQNVLDAMGPKSKAALLANHGAVSMGIDIQDAFNVATYLEKMAQVAAFAFILGEGKLQGVDV
jgi:L-ribulose-5-phosphate 4-epimerase